MPGYPRLFLMNFAFFKIQTRSTTISCRRHLIMITKLLITVRASRWYATENYAPEAIDNRRRVPVIDNRSRVITAAVYTYAYDKINNVRGNDTGGGYCSASLTTSHVPRFQSICYWTFVLL